MLRIHKEGVMMLLGMAVILTVIGGLIFWLAPSVFPYAAIIFIGLFLIVLQFFRNPKRPIEVFDDSVVYAPADGKVVVIEETVETEYFKDKRIQVSIFMSPFNVHVNRNPIGGIVKFFRYHEGKYLVAWHPKASTENERTTVVIDNGKSQVLFRQIAGALAKRIIAYVKEGETVTQGADMGFIKFGSRVDLYLPLDAKIDVKIDDVVKGNWTVVARLK
jgi:phosphatidylserine decarboxylase